MADDESIAGRFMSLRASLARAVTGIVPPKDVEDIVQEAYVRVCQAETRDNVRKPRSFLFRTVRNLALDHVKRAESRLAVSVEENRELGFGEGQRARDETLERVSSDEEFSRFCDAVRRLPVQCRRAFVLKKVYGYTQREIAMELGLSESTVEKHIAEGIKRCSYFMMHYDGSDVHVGRSPHTSHTRHGGRS